MQAWVAWVWEQGASIGGVGVCGVCGWGASTGGVGTTAGSHGLSPSVVVLLALCVVVVVVVAAGKSAGRVAALSRTQSLIRLHECMHVRACWVGMICCL